MAGYGMRLSQKAALGARLRGQGGFTLIELMTVVIIIGIMAVIALPLYSSVMQRTRIARVQADVRVLVTGITMYSAHVGQPPVTLDALTATAANVQGLTAGPFLSAIPAPPSSLWTDYGPGYVVDTASGAFTVSAAGEGATVSLP